MTEINSNNQIVIDRQKCAKSEDPRACLQREFASAIKTIDSPDLLVALPEMPAFLSSKEQEPTLKFFASTQRPVVPGIWTNVKDLAKYTAGCFGEICYLQVERFVHTQQPKMNAAGCGGGSPGVNSLVDGGHEVYFPTTDVGPSNDSVAALDADAAIREDSSIDGDVDGYTDGSTDVGDDFVPGPDVDAASPDSVTPDADVTTGPDVEVKPDIPWSDTSDAKDISELPPQISPIEFPDKDPTGGVLMLYGCKNIVDNCDASVANESLVSSAEMLKILYGSNAGLATKEGESIGAFFSLRPNDPQDGKGIPLIFDDSGVGTDVVPSCADSNMRLPGANITKLRMGKTTSIGTTWFPLAGEAQYGPALDANLFPTPAEPNQTQILVKTNIIAYNVTRTCNNCIDGANACFFAYSYIPKK